MNPILKPIMLVEDDHSIMSSMVEIFTYLDRSLILAHNGREGIDLLKNLSPAEYPCCIILDLMMPEMSGEEFILKLQALGQVDLDSIPIVVSSASARIDKMQNPRVVRKLKKPIDLSHLEEIAAAFT